MSTRRIDATHLRLAILAARTAKNLLDGHDVVIKFHKNADPERILGTLNGLIGEYEVEVICRHADLKEYFTNIAKGATEGAAVGGSLGALVAIILGAAAPPAMPVTLPAVLSAAGIGALTGALAGIAGGAAYTRIHSLTIYKHKEETHVRLSQPEKKAA